MKDLHSDRAPLIDRAYSMARYLYVDIETIPTQDHAVAKALCDAIKPPGSIKRAESIEAWHAEQGAAAAEKAVAETSFDGAYGHVCTISWAINDGEVNTLHAEETAQEESIVSGFFDALDPYHSVIVVGHNVAAFDLAFLRKRAIVLGVALPPPGALPRDAKAWDKNIHDTMVMWAGARDHIGLDRLCGVLGVPGKGDMDGSQVAQAWAEGRHAEIAKYCADDVQRVRTVHQRFLAVGW